MEEKKEAKKRSVEEIDAEIAQVKKELEDVHGTEAEVCARIVGYYRSVKNWNKGKREEYGKRKMFKQDGENAARHLPKDGACCCGNETAAGAHVVKEAVR